MIKDPISFPPGPYNDTYNARIFAKHYENEVLWSKVHGGWFIWSGMKWELDHNEKIKGFAIKIVDEMQAYTEKFDGSPQMRQAWLSHIKNSGQNARLEAMLDCAKSFLMLKMNFDYDGWKLNVENGVVDLKNGNIIPHDPYFYMTKSADIKFDKTEKCPLWMKFLNDIFIKDQDVIDFVQKAIGYSLTGNTQEQCLFIFYGHGRNGKSTFINIISELLGEYGRNCPSSTFMKKQNNNMTNDIARLHGARFVTTFESNQNISFDESIIKQITGNDKISARFLHAEFFEFTPTFKIFFSTNHKPTIKGTDSGIWRRIRMIPFSFSVEDGNDDKNIGLKLKEEINGIFNWAMEGCLKWQKEGLVMPEALIRATKQYQKEEDNIGQFIIDECTIKEGQAISLSEFKERLYEYLGYRMSRKVIHDYMLYKRFIPQNDDRVSINGKQVRAYVGLCLKSDYKEGVTSYADEQIEWEG